MTDILPLERHPLQWVTPSSSPVTTPNASTCRWLLTIMGALVDSPFAPSHTFYMIALVTSQHDALEIVRGPPSHRVPLTQLFTTAAPSLVDFLKSTHVALHRKLVSIRSCSLRPWMICWSNNMSGQRGILELRLSQTLPISLFRSLYWGSLFMVVPF